MGSPSSVESSASCIFLTQKLGHIEERSEKKINFTNYQYSFFFFKKSSAANSFLRKSKKSIYLFDFLAKMFLQSWSLLTYLHRVIWPKICKRRYETWYIWCFRLMFCKGSWGVTKFMDQIITRSQDHKKRAPHLQAFSLITRAFLLSVNIVRLRLDDVTGQ